MGGNGEAFVPAALLAGRQGNVTAHAQTGWKRTFAMNKTLRALTAAALLAFSAPVLAQAPAPAPSAPAAAPAKTAPGGAMMAKPALLDINSASQDDLQALKGIGEVRAKAIIAGRPYKGKDELVQKNVLTQGVYDGIKNQIVARQK
jgi:DNA uptake protein ComE-like DNA-binding protein